MVARGACATLRCLEGEGMEAGADEVIDRAADVVEHVRTVTPEGIDVALDVVAGRDFAARV